MGDIGLLRIEKGNIGKQAIGPGTYWRLKNMKFRVYFQNLKYFPTYFKTKKDAVEFQKIHGGDIQRKVAHEWVNC